MTHLVELLRAADPLAHGFKQVVLWGGMPTFARIHDRDWLIKLNRPGFRGDSRWTACCVAKTAASATANACVSVMFELWQREYGITF